MLTEPDDVFASQDLGEMLAEGVDKSDDALALSAILEGVRRRGFSDAPWTVNVNFLPSVSALVRGGPGSLPRGIVRACVDTVLSENMGATHQLRRGPGANEPHRVRTRDNAGAWRRDIDHEYHLHYWSTAAGPELATVVVHVDMSIPA